MAAPVKFLIPRKQYLSSGIHIGMKQHTKEMKKYIYRVRPDGLAVLNLRMIDERIRIAAKFLARKKNILVVARKGSAHAAIKKFGEIVGAKVVAGRFMPGTMTNPNYDGFYEADVVMVVDPLSDRQAVEEAVKARVPVVALCDTFNETTDIDLVIPANIKGKKSIATIFWLLAREIQKERGEIKRDRDFKYEIKDFLK
jgi:small subunit ribosomal protein S2